MLSAHTGAPPALPAPRLARLALRARRRGRAARPGRAPSAARSRPRAARSATMAWAPRARAPACAPHVTAHVVSWGGRVGMSKTSCAARCSRGSVQGVLRAPAKGEDGLAHTVRTSLLPPPSRSSGAPVRWLMARGRRASGVAAAPRSRAAGAPATRRRRAVGGACACRARSNSQTAGEDLWWVVVVVVVVRTPTPNYLRQASPDRVTYLPDRGKYGTC